MRVGLDLDNVLVSTMASARRVIAQLREIPFEEIIETQEYWTPFSHQNPKLASRLVPDHAFWDREDLLLNADPLPGAIEAANILAKEGMLASYITRRPPAVASITEKWLKRQNFPIVPTHHVGSLNPDEYHANCKSSACRIEGVTHMVDDQAKEAEKLLSAGIQVVLVDAAIGRVDRHQYISVNPEIPVANDILHAVEMLLATRCLA